MIQSSRKTSKTDSGWLLCVITTQRVYWPKYRNVEFWDRNLNQALSHLIRYVIEIESFEKSSLLDYCFNIIIDLCLHHTKPRISVQWLKIIDDRNKWHIFIINRLHKLPNHTRSNIDKKHHFFLQIISVDECFFVYCFIGLRCMWKRIMLVSHVLNRFRIRYCTKTTVEIVYLWTDNVQ